jgi:UDP-N-acetylglucosamine diphosphorylase/glucosamine-1-phosphate N-acetyltransferase
MNVVLYDEPGARQHLLPFTFTRPVAEIRVGILTITEKWKLELSLPVCWQTEAYLSGKFPCTPATDNLFIDGSLCPDAELVQAVLALKPGEGIEHNHTVLAYRSASAGDQVRLQPFKGQVMRIDRLWKIFQYNGTELVKDFQRLTRNRSSKPITDVHTRVYNPDQIFAEEGVEIRAAILNAEQGPIYLGRNSSIQEGAIIKGPFALCEGAVVNMGAKMRGDTTIGPYCKVGGEVSNSVFFAFSNKAHDGFLGNSVIGEWCNLGADTNSSNLKNNYEEVKLWSYAKGGFIPTGLQFCGLMMGDHSKCGINTMFNTGTVVGVSANIFGAGFPRNFIPSFSWGGASGFTTYQLARALETAHRSMARRNKTLHETDRKILSTVFELTAPYRIWEKK